MMRSMALLGLLLTTVPMCVGAQALEVGDRVRVRTGDGLVTGTVEELTVELLRIRTGPNARRIVPLDRVDGLELSVGRERGLAKPFLITVGAGVVLGGLMAAVTYDPCEPSGVLSCVLASDSRTEAAGMGMRVGGAISLPIGLALGLLGREDIWEPIEVPGVGTASVSFRPLGGLLGVRGSIEIGGP